MVLNSQAETRGSERLRNIPSIVFWCSFCFSLSQANLIDFLIEPASSSLTVRKPQGALIPACCSLPKLLPHPRLAFPASGGALLGCLSPQGTCGLISIHSKSFISGIMSLTLLQWWADGMFIHPVLFKPIRWI